MTDTLNERTELAFDGLSQGQIDSGQAEKLRQLLQNDVAPQRRTYPTLKRDFIAPEGESAMSVPLSSAAFSRSLRQLNISPSPLGAVRSPEGDSARFDIDVHKVKHSNIDSRVTGASAGNTARPTNAPRRSDSAKVTNIAVAVLAVVALVSVSLLAVSRSQGPTPETIAMEGFHSQQNVVAAETRRLASAYERFTDAKTAAVALNLATAGAIAAVAGSSDETARLAVDSRRLEFERAIAAQASDDPAAIEYVTPKVGDEATLTEISRGIDDLTAEANRLEALTEKTAAAASAVDGAREVFVGAFREFGETIPATASALLKTSQEADRAWRDAVTASVAALSAALARSQTGVEELQAYGAAALALQNENARVIEEDEQSVDPVPPRDSVEPRSPSTPPVVPVAPVAPVVPVAPTPEPIPVPAPVEPQPEPSPPPAAEPSPEPNSP